MTAHRETVHSPAAGTAASTGRARPAQGPSLRRHTGGMDHDTIAPTTVTARPVADEPVDGQTCDRPDRTSVLADTVVPSPLGPLLIAATERGVVRVAFATEGVDPVIEELVARLAPDTIESVPPVDPAAAGRPGPDTAVRRRDRGAPGLAVGLPDPWLADRDAPHASALRTLDETALELREYFSGDRRAFAVAVDDVLSHGFALEVRRELRRIPYGETASYAAIAARTGRPRAVRAVGSGCSGNPVPIIVPCHRVVRSDGSLGGYRGGMPAKALLQRLERETLAGRPPVGAPCAARATAGATGHRPAPADAPAPARPSATGDRG